MRYYSWTNWSSLASTIIFYWAYQLSLIDESFVDDHYLDYVLRNKRVAQVQDEMLLHQAIIFTAFLIPSLLYFFAVFEDYRTYQLALYCIYNVFTIAIVI